MKSLSLFFSFFFTSLLAISLYFFYVFQGYAQTDANQSCNANGVSGECYMSTIGEPTCPNGYKEAITGKQLCTPDNCTGGGYIGPCPYVGCCIPNPTPTSAPTCASTGGVCDSGFGCPQDYTYGVNAYECPITTGGGCCVPMQCTDLSGNGACSAELSPCGANRTSNYLDSTMGNSCVSNNSSCCVDEQSCNTGAVQTGACSALNPAANTCGYTTFYDKYTNEQYANPQCEQSGTSGNGYSCTPTGPCYWNNFNVACGTQHYNNCNASAGYTCNDPNTGTVCITNISVNVHTDWNHDGAGGTGDTDRNGVPISDNGGNIFNTGQFGVNGNVTFTQKAMGPGHITMTTPANFQIVASTGKDQNGNANDTTLSPSTDVTFTLDATHGNEQVDYYVTPLYTLSGQVFTDINLDGKKNGNDTGYGPGTVNITGPTNVGNVSTDNNGNYSVGNLLAGVYTVTYTTPLGTNYKYTTNSVWQVTLGDPAGSPACNTSTSLDATCGGQNNGSISNLNFGITNENAWNQSICWDVRNDNNGGTYSDPIPAAPSCGGVNGAYNTLTNADCTTGAGIVYSCNGSFDFGLGSANQLDWKAGGNGNDAECYTPGGLDVIRTSYDYIMTTAQESNIIPTNLDNTVNPDPTTSCDVTNCTLPDNLPRGIYSVDGDLHLNAFTFPTVATTSAYIFAIKGNLYLDGNIIVPQNSVAFFTSGSNIYVDPSVGQNITTLGVNNPLVNSPNLEGMYSADNSFIVQRDSTQPTCNIDGTPIDLKLNIVGSVIANAAQGGGSLINNRNLCEYDNQCSSITMGDNSGLSISYLLNLFADGGFLQHRNFNWEELKP